jgi:PAS domain S-box-containing protein
MRSLRIKLRQQAAEIETRFRLQTDLEHRNAELVEQAGEIILRLDAGGIIEDANPAAGRFFGRPAGELVGSALANLFELEDRPRLVLALAKARTEGSGERLEFRCRSGERGLRWLEIQLQSITAPGAAPSLGGVARDISDRKRAEDTLRQSEQNLRRIIEFLPDGVVLLDSRGIIRFQNTRACMLLGHAPGGLVGLPLESLRCPPLDAWVGELLESSDRSPEGLRGGRHAHPGPWPLRRDGTSRGRFRRRRGPRRNALLPGLLPQRRLPWFSLFPSRCWTTCSAPRRSLCRGRLHCL